MNIERVVDCLARGCIVMAMTISLAACAPHKESSCSVLPYKKRRIIVNDDGEVPPPANGQTVEEYMDINFTPSLNSQVDTYFLTVGATDRGPGSGIAPRIQDTQNRWFPEMRPRPDIDRLTRAYLKATRKVGMEIFASFRMNDIHDSWAEKLTYPLKVKRPDVLIGKDYLPAGYPHSLEGEQGGSPYRYPSSAMRAFWSSLDYGKEEVRQHFLDFILSYCRHYDYDGVELEFGRHAMFFKFGEIEENIETMTQFVREVRKGLNAIARDRGKSYLLTARVPDSPKMALSIGLDVQQWLEEGLLDMLIVGFGYMCDSSRIKPFIDLAHRQNIPAYVSITDVFEPIKMRSWASNFYALGADGVYIYNWGDPSAKAKRYGADSPDEVMSTLHQLGDPDTLVGLDKIYVPDNGTTVFYRGVTNAVGRFPAEPLHGIEHRIHPVWLAEGTPIELVVGDDLKKADRQDLLKELQLRIDVSNMDVLEGIVIKINGKRVSQASIKRINSTSFTATVKPSMFERGVNQVMILHGPNSIGRYNSTVTGLELSVRYKRN